MMGMLVWRPLVILVGMVGASIAGAVSAISLNPIASGTLAGFVIAMMVFQALVSIALIVYGVWSPVKRWLAGGPTNA